MWRTDGRTDGQTDRETDVKPIAITCFSIADARKKERILIPHVLWKLHWLPVRRCVDFKLQGHANVQVTAWSGQAAPWQSIWRMQCQLVPDVNRRLRSCKCVLPLTQTRLGDWQVVCCASIITFGRWLFVVYASRLLKAHSFDWGAAAVTFVLFSCTLYKFSLTYIDKWTKHANTAMRMLALHQHSQHNEVQERLTQSI